jgi:predicted nucleic acid-binding protein
MIYFDSSALVKKYVVETGTDMVLGLVSHASLRATSKLAWPEILSGLGRKRREKGITEKDYQKATETFVTDWSSFLIVEFQDELLLRIRKLAHIHALKGADLVHLASVLWLQEATSKEMTLVTSDGQLLKAAKTENLKAIDPTS